MISASLNGRYQFCIRKSEYVKHNNEIKLSNNVLIVLSDALCWYMSGDNKNIIG